MPACEGEEHPFGNPCDIFFFLGGGEAGGGDPSRLPAWRGGCEAEPPARRRAGTGREAGGDAGMRGRLEMLGTVSGVGFGGVFPPVPRQD